MCSDNNDAVSAEADSAIDCPQPIAGHAGDALQFVLHSN